MVETKQGRWDYVLHQRDIYPTGQYSPIFLINNKLYVIIIEKSGRLGKCIEKKAFGRALNNITH